MFTRGFLNFIFSLFCFVATAEEKPVALHVYLYDGNAFELSHAQVTEDIFADLLPDVRYKLVAINANQAFLSGKNQQKISAQLNEELEKALEPDEKIAFLIIDTHGETVKGKKEPELGFGTKLLKLGTVYESGVDESFTQNFQKLKGKAAPDMKVLLNSCSVFCGGKESAAKRGQQILNFFGAHEGSIYGADVPEVSYALDHLRYLREEYIRPSWKIFVASAVVGATVGILGTPLDFFDPATYFESAKNTAMYGGSVFLGFSIFRPMYLWLMSKFKLNRGFAFSYKNGELQSWSRMIKSRDLFAFLKSQLPSGDCAQLLTAP